jgi:hypothetical protein
VANRRDEIINKLVSDTQKKCAERIKQAKILSSDKITINIRECGITSGMKKKYGL